MCWWMQMNPNVSDLALYDIQGTPGVAADISHINSKAITKVSCNPYQLWLCLIWRIVAFAEPSFVSFCRDTLVQSSWERHWRALMLSSSLLVCPGSPVWLAMISSRCVHAEPTSCMSCSLWCCFKRMVHRRSSCSLKCLVNLVSLGVSTHQSLSGCRPMRELSGTSSPLSQSMPPGCVMLQSFAQTVRQNLNALQRTIGAYFADMLSSDHDHF